LTVGARRVDEKSATCGARYGRAPRSLQGGEGRVRFPSSLPPPSQKPYHRVQFARRPAMRNDDLEQQIVAGHSTGVPRLQSTATATEQTQRARQAAAAKRTPYTSIQPTSYPLPDCNFSAAVVAKRRCRRQRIGRLAAGPVTRFCRPARQDAQKRFNYEKLEKSTDLSENVNGTRWAMTAAAGGVH